MKGGKRGRDGPLATGGMCKVLIGWEIAADGTTIKDTGVLLIAAVSRDSMAMMDVMEPSAAAVFT